MQQQARRQQIERDLEGLIAQDLRFVNVFQEHSLAARELRAQADELRATDPAAADVLDLEAQSRLDLARVIQPFFLGATGATLGDDGTVAYDVAYVMRNLADGQRELRELRTARTEELGARADARSVSLVGVAAAIVAALFFLTIAQVTGTRARIKQAFLVAGGLLVVVGLVLVRARGDIRVTDEQAICDRGRRGSSRAPRRPACRARGDHHRLRHARRGNLRVSPGRRVPARRGSARPGRAIRARRARECPEHA